MAKGKTVKRPMDDDAEEASEAPFEGSLTPLGQRTLAGYKTRFGEEQGEDKFQAALKAGRLDRTKMLKNSSNATKG